MIPHLPFNSGKKEGQIISSQYFSRWVILDREISPGSEGFTLQTVGGSDFDCI